MHDGTSARGTNERWRWRIALGIALLGHGLLYYAASRSEVGTEPVAHVRAPEPNTQVDIELNPPEQSPPERAAMTPERASTPGRASTPEPAPKSERGAPPERAAADPGASDAPSAELRSAPAESETPGLSLDALGVGERNPFLDGRGHGDRPRDAARETSKRVDRALADGIAKADQQRALGPEGPLLASIEQEARRSTTPPNSTALFRLSTDGNGTLVGVQVIDANSDQTEWQKLGDRVLAQLGKRRLRGAHGQNGLTFEIRVTSRVALPSGRDPGLEIDIFNIPVKKGSGKHPSRVRVLDVLPTYSVEDVKLPDGRIVQVPTINQAILAVDGDPVDIGAPARRMVHARLERLWAN